MTGVGRWGWCTAHAAPVLRGVSLNGHLVAARPQEYGVEGPSFAIESEAQELREEGWREPRPRERLGLAQGHTAFSGRPGPGERSLPAWSRAGEEEEEQAWRVRASWKWVDVLTPISTPGILPIRKKVLKPPL